jgi:hypothetical protein
MRSKYNSWREPPLHPRDSPARLLALHPLAGRERTRLQPGESVCGQCPGSFRANAGQGGVLTDGPSWTVKIGPTTIQLQSTTAKNMAATGRLSGHLIQDLRELGKEHVTPERRQHLKRTLPADAACTSSKRLGILFESKFAGSLVSKSECGTSRNGEAPKRKQGYRSARPPRLGCGMEEPVFLARGIRQSRTTPPAQLRLKDSA